MTSGTGYALGVDLGTSFTAVAATVDGHAEMVSLGERTVVAPSVVFAGSDGKLTSGDRAVRRGAAEPGRSAREFKRRLGDPTPFILGGATYSPAALMAATLTDAVGAATRLFGRPPAEVVLSRPAVWGPYRLEQFDEVPRLAGLEGVRLVTEPVAAATHYSAARPPAEGDVVAVYDLGGGTFDTAVLRRDQGEISILGAPEGVEWLGGSDFDEAVLGFVDRELGGAVTRLDPRDPEMAPALTRLRTECVLAKEALSFDEETTIAVFLPGVRRSVTLTRAEFEEMIQPAVGSTVEALGRALRSAGVAADELSAVLLVGGSSRIPLIARRLEEALGRPTVVNAHPKHAVALGAAEIAGRLLTPASRSPAGGATGSATTTQERPAPSDALAAAVAWSGHREQGVRTAAAVAQHVTAEHDPAPDPPDAPGAHRVVGNHRYRGTTRGSAGLRGDEGMRTALVLLLVAVVVVVVAGVLGTVWGRSHRPGALPGVSAAGPVTAAGRATIT